MRRERSLRDFKLANRLLRSVGLGRSDLIVGLLVLAGVIVGVGIFYLALAPTSPPPYP